MGKTHINQKTTEDESQRKSIVFVISILQVHIPHKFLVGFCIRCKMKKIHCPCHRSVGWKRKVHRPLAASAICKLLGLLFLCGRKHQYLNSALGYTVLSTNVLTVTVQVNKEYPDKNRN